MTLTRGDVTARTVSDVMITDPKTQPANATIADVRAAFDDDHVHMVLLTRAGVLHGTLVREDIPAAAPGPRPALDLASLHDRTIAPHEHLDAARRRLETPGQRRIAVVDDANRLLGLVCLKRDRTGFCTDDGVRSRMLSRSDLGPTWSAQHHGVGARQPSCWP
jgi:CBS domain-containing protein